MNKKRQKAINELLNQIQKEYKQLRKEKFDQETKGNLDRAIKAKLQIDIINKFYAPLKAIASLSDTTESDDIDVIISESDKQQYDCGYCDGSVTRCDGSCIPKDKRTAVALLNDLWEHPELRLDTRFTYQVESFLANER